MDFTIEGPVWDIETIASGRAIREIKILRKRYGLGNWKKRKGIARLKLDNGQLCIAEIHWYEAHGIGKVKYKVKRLLTRL